MKASNANLPANMISTYMLLFLSIKSFIGLRLAAFNNCFTSIFHSVLYVKFKRG